MYVQNTYRVSRVSTFFFFLGTKSFYETYILTKIIWKGVLNEKTAKFLSLLKTWDITSDIFYKLSKQYTDQIT